MENIALAILEIESIAESVNPIEYEDCTACRSLHGDSGRHRKARQYGSHGSKMRRLAGVARALRVRLGESPIDDAAQVTPRDKRATKAMNEIGDWATPLVDSADVMTGSLARDAIAALREVA